MGSTPRASEPIDFGCAPTMPTMESSKSRPKRSAEQGFTIVEVVIAAGVMIFAISTSLIALQYGMRAIDNARYTTLAGQILQSQIEKLRLLSFLQLTDTSNGPFTTDTSKTYYISSSSSWFTPDVGTSTTTAQLSNFKVNGVSNRCLQTIALPSVADGSGTTWDAMMRVVTVTATWTGSDGRVHTLSYSTRFCRYGLSSFFYVSH